MMAIIGSAWLVIGVGVWLWSAAAFEDRSQAVSVLPIIVLFWPVLVIGLLATALVWKFWELHR